MESVVLCNWKGNCDAIPLRRPRLDLVCLHACFTMTNPIQPTRRDLFFPPQLSSCPLPALVGGCDMGSELSLTSGPKGENPSSPPPPAGGGWTHPQPTPWGRQPLQKKNSTGGHCTQHCPLPSAPLSDLGGEGAGRGVDLSGVRAGDVEGGEWPHRIAGGEVDHRDG